MSKIITGLVIAVALVAVGYLVAVQRFDIGMSGTPTPPPGCYYHQVECIKAPCNPELVCPISPSPTATAVTSTTYRNTQYGFELTFPTTWNGYAITDNTWTGTDIASGKQTERGPQVTFRHVNYPTTGQQISIMVFTPTQWAKIQAETMSLGAAPIGPSKVGQNSKYVFATPARWEFSYTNGSDIQEAQTIIDSIHTF